MKKEKKNRVKGVFGTVLFHALLLLLLSLPFMSLTYQDPPPKKGGGSIAINFSSEINTKPLEEEIIKSTEEIVTQTTTDALVVKKPEKKKKKPKKEVIEEKKTEINKKALYPGKKKTTTTSEGEGKSTGDENVGGSGEGNGDYQLGGRKPTFKPTPQGSQIDGKVVVAITVDRLGNVITASTDGVPGSTTFNKQLLKRAKTAALKTKFEPKESAPTNQQGKIIYYFHLN